MCIYIHCLTGNTLIPQIDIVRLCQLFIRNILERFCGNAILRCSILEYIGFIILCFNCKQIISLYKRPNVDAVAAHAYRVHVKRIGFQLISIHVL